MLQLFLIVQQKHGNLYLPESVLLEQKCTHRADLKLYNPPFQAGLYLLYAWRIALLTPSDCLSRADISYG